MERGLLSELRDRTAAADLKGEFVVVVGGADPKNRVEE